MCSPCATVKNINIYRFGTISLPFWKKSALDVPQKFRNIPFGKKKPLNVICKEIL